MTDEAVETGAGAAADTADVSARNVLRPAAAAEPWFYREDLRDVAFFAEHRAEILAAMKAGRIVDRQPGRRPAGRSSRTILQEKQP